jgi:hypothetical protein
LEFLPAQNTAHKKAFCKGCVSYHLLQASLNAEISEELDPAAILQVERNNFNDELIQPLLTACNAAGHVRGKKTALIAHIRSLCPCFGGGNRSCDCFKAVIQSLGQEFHDCEPSGFKHQADSEHV